MKMKIAVQIPVSAEEGDEMVLFQLAFLRKGIELVKDPETKITIQMLNRGVIAITSLAYKYTETLNQRGILEGVLQAEKDGYDGALIYCFNDPTLWEARQAVNIPVVGLGQSAMLLASVMGANFGLVCINDTIRHIYIENAKRYGLDGRLAGIRPLKTPIMEQLMGILDAHDAIKDFQEVGRELIKDGAEVLIPACGAMTAVLRQAPGCQEDYPNGVTDVDGVPVMDVASSALLLLETLIKLKQSGSCWISRKSYYARPDDEALECAASLLGPIVSEGIWRA